MILPESKWVSKGCLEQWNITRHIQLACKVKSSTIQVTCHTSYEVQRTGQQCTRCTATSRLLSLRQPEAGLNGFQLLQPSLHRSGAPLGLAAKLLYRCGLWLMWPRRGARSCSRGWPGACRGGRQACISNGSAGYNWILTAKARASTGLQCPPPKNMVCHGWQ